MVIVGLCRRVELKFRQNGVDNQSIHWLNNWCLLLCKGWVFLFNSSIIRLITMKKCVPSCYRHIKWFGSEGKRWSSKVCVQIVNMGQAGMCFQRRENCCNQCSTVFANTIVGLWSTKHSFGLMGLNHPRVCFTNIGDCVNIKALLDHRDGIRNKTIKFPHLISPNGHQPVLFCSRAFINWASCQPLGSWIATSSAISNRLTRSGS